MAIVKDISAQVLSVSNDIIKIRLGSVQVDLTKEQLMMYMDPSQHDPIETVLRNIGLRLALADISLEDGVAVKDQLDKVNFKSLGQ